MFAAEMNVIGAAASGRLRKGPGHHIAARVGKAREIEFRDHEIFELVPKLNLFEVQLLSFKESPGPGTSYRNTPERSASFQATDLSR